METDGNGDGRDDNNGVKIRVVVEMRLKKKI